MSRTRQGRLATQAATRSLVPRIIYGLEYASEGGLRCSEFRLGPSDDLLVTHQPALKGRRNGRGALSYASSIVRLCELQKAALLHI